MLRWLYDSDSLGARSGVISFFGGRGVVGAPAGQNSSAFMMCGGSGSIFGGTNVAVAAVKLTFIFSPAFEIRSYASLAI